jgi:hypothetical protein
MENNRTRTIEEWPGARVWYASGEAEGTAGWVLTYPNHSTGDEAEMKLSTSNLDEEEQAVAEATQWLNENEGKDLEAGPAGVIRGLSR